MVRNIILVVTLIAILAAGFYSCAKNQIGPTPLEPDSPELMNVPSSQADHAGHYVWSYFVVDVDSDAGSVIVTPVRQVEGHWNVLKFLEYGPCTTCVTILDFRSTENGTKEFDVQISHPFTNPKFTGFDVRGIAMFSGSRDYPSFGLTGSDESYGDGELVNADGYTSLYNPTTMDDGAGFIDSYIKGKFASPVNTPNATLNGYKRHVTDNESNTRNALYSSSTATATYEIAIPAQKFVFGYAVDASWAPPSSDPVTDPMSDFSPEANCFEPWKIETSLTPVETGLTDEGGSTNINLTVFDWQGTSSHLAPVVECPDLFSGTRTAVQVAEYDGSSRWRVEVPNNNWAPPGTYQCVIKVEDVKI